MKNEGYSNVVIIGGVAAGPKTGAALARRMPDIKITLFQREEYISYASCGMPYFASGDVNSFNSLTMTSYGVERSVDFFKKTKGFDVITGSEVTSIDRNTKTVTVRTIADGSVYTHGYGTLVIATGARPVRPSFPVPDHPNIRYFTSPDDALYFKKTAQQGKLNSVVIVGGGYIGCEMAEAVRVWGFETTLIERESQVLPATLDADIAEFVKSEMVRNGVNVITGASVTSIQTKENRLSLDVTNNGVLEADYVILCLGVRPEASLAASCGLSIGKTGGIIVDEHMRTSDAAIYAGGDCVELKHGVTGIGAHVPLGSLANRHGWIIAENISGKAASFSNVLGASVIKVFGLNTGCTGITENAARAHGIDVEYVLAAFSDKPFYYPDANDIVLKMVFAKDTRTLLGLQAAGRGDICRRVDVFSSLLRNHANINDLLAFEHGYAPPFSEALDPLHHMGSIALAMDRGLSFINPLRAIAYFVKNEVPSGAMILDVRETVQYTANPWPEAGNPRILHIPLNDLRDRLHELDTSKEYHILCGKGARAYQAWTILHNAGFPRAHVIAGGMTFLSGIVR